MLTRRRFLTALIPGCALAFTGLAYVGYRRGGCPLSNSGACEGPCTALVDANGDLLCDRILLPVVQAEAPETPATNSAGDESAARPPASPTTQPTAAPQLTSAPQPTPTVHAKPTPLPVRPKQAAPPAASPRQAVACPYGLVNDRYPGRCRRYRDSNGNGVCDLSEPAS